MSYNIQHISAKREQDIGQRNKLNRSVLYEKRCNMKKIILISLLLWVKGLFGFQSVNINQASAEQIALLPEVGGKLAHDIVLYRMQHGAFVTKQDLLKVPGLSEKKLARFLEHLVIEGKNSKSKHHKHEPDTERITLKAPPPVDVFEHHVLKTHDLQTDFDASLAYRARRYAWLPKLSAGLDVDHDRMMAEKMTDGSKDSLMTRGGRGVGLGIRLTFDFEKLIFNTDELEVAKLSLRRSEARQAILKEMHDIYFTYVRFYESSKNPIAKQDVQDVRQEVLQTVAKLDAMSNGAFSKLMSME